MANGFCYVELHTGETSASKKFYKSLFGWKTSEMNMGGPVPYIMIHPEGGTGGGIAQKAGAEVPNMWLPYVEVKSVKRSLAKAAAAGSKVVLDYMSIGAMGAIGVFVDPFGAAIGVWEPVKQAPAKKAAKKAPAKKKAAKKK